MRQCNNCNLGGERDALWRMCAHEGHVVNVGELLCDEESEGREREQHSHGDIEAVATPDALAV